MTGMSSHRDDNEHPSQALAALIDQHFDADATAALLALGQLAGIDIAYLDRTYFTNYLHDHPLTDEEWQRIAAELGEYCNVIDDLCNEAVANYTDSILRSAKIIPAGEEASDD